MKTVKFALSCDGVGVTDLPPDDSIPNIPYVELEVPDPAFLQTFVEFMYEFHAREGVPLKEIGLPPEVYLITILAIKEIAQWGENLPGVPDEFTYCGVRAICVADGFARLTGRSILKHAWLDQAERKRRQAECEKLFAACGVKPPDYSKPVSPFKKEDLN